MGCFSFICKESGLPVASSSFDGDACRMYLLKDGKVIEEMRGHYNSYGGVFKENKDESFEWKMDWDDVCNLMDDKDNGNGIAVILERFFRGNIPTSRSYDDPNQGWGCENGGGVVIENPFHKVF